MKKSELSLINLENSFNTLKECYGDYCSQKDEKLKNYIKDSCIKRFEYTYETSKKIMNKFLKKEYDKTEKELSINNIFRDMYGLNLIESFENWAEYRELRNAVFDEYNDNNFNQIIDIIPKFIKDIDYLITSINKVLQDD